MHYNYEYMDKIYMSIDAKTDVVLVAYQQIESFILLNTP